MRNEAGCGLIHFDVLSPLESLKMINTEELLQMRTRHTWADDNSEKKGKELVPSGFAVLGMIILVFILAFIPVIMLVFILVIILIIPEIIV